MTKRRYNYEERADAETIRWMKNEARKAGIPYAQWCRRAGIITDWDEKKINRNESLESEVGPRTMGAIVSRLSADEYAGVTPGGDQIGSIIIDRRAPVRPPKRKRGRPRKNFVMVPNES